MSDKTLSRSVSTALGMSFAVSLVASPLVLAADNPFSVTELQSSFLVADAAEGKCGEGKCGTGKKDAGEASAEKSAEGKCGEGKCGTDIKKDKAQSEGSCGSNK
jgi:uncharacterized low-complexity protein